MKVRTPYDHWYKIDTLTGGLVDGGREEGVTDLRGGRTGGGRGGRQREEGGRDPSLIDRWKGAWDKVHAVHNLFSLRSTLFLRPHGVYF